MQISDLLTPDYIEKNKSLLQIMVANMDNDKLFCAGLLCNGCFLEVEDPGCSRIGFDDEDIVAAVRQAVSED